MRTMRSYLLMTVTGIVLSGCAGGPEGSPPSLTYNYVEGQRIEPPVDKPPMPEMGPMAGLPLEPEPPEKLWKSDGEKIADATKRAKRNALDCSFEGEIMTCPYQNGLRYKLRLDAPTAERSQDSFQTELWLEPGEKMPEAIFNDPQWFSAEISGGGIDTSSMKYKRDKNNGIKTEGAGLIIIVKSYKPGARGTLTVATGSRRYLYDIVTNACKQPEGQAPRKCNAPYNAVVQHTYESDQPKPREATQARQRPTPRIASTRYSYDGAAEFLPNEWSAYNDGVNTYIVPPARLASRPVPMFPEGGPSSFWVDPATSNYVIRGLPREVAFKRGDQTLTVRQEQ